MHLVPLVESRVEFRRITPWHNPFVGVADGLLKNSIESWCEPPTLRVTKADQDTLPPSLHVLHNAIDGVLVLRHRLVAHFLFLTGRLVPAPHDDQNGFINNEVVEFARHLELGVGVVRGDASQLCRRISGSGFPVLFLCEPVASDPDVLQLGAWLDTILRLTDAERLVFSGVAMSGPCLPPFLLTSRNFNVESDAT